MKRLRYGLITAYLILGFLLALPIRAWAADNNVRQYRILYISSYGYANEAVPPELEGFKEGLDDINVDIRFEFMDGDNYYSAIDIQNFDKYLRYKFFSKRNYDLIAVADDQALRYAINNRNSLFPNVPMVFMGVNSQTEAVTAAAMKNATGIAETPDFEANFQLMKKLFPAREHINVIVDSSVAGQGDYVEFMKFKEKHPELSSTIVNTAYYTAGGLKDLLASLGDKDIILFLDFTLDGDRNSYSLNNASEFLSENASHIPIFRLASSDIGHGVLGGISYSYYDSARMAGEVSKRILLGESADDIPLMASTVTTPYFEQGAMDRFGIKYSQLPQGAVVRNEHQNLAKFYRENRVLSNLAIVVVLLMIAIIVLLHLTNVRRKRMIRTDFLTQMPNRKKIIEDINLAISQSVPYGVIMLDVDHFKDVNDTYGHKVGDEVIIEVGERLKKLACRDITFARLGGDEFCGLFMASTAETGEKICKDIMSSTKKKFKTSAGDLKLTVSIGCAMFPEETYDNQNVIECADKALYVTKEKGRNGYTLFGDINKS